MIPYLPSILITVDVEDYFQVENLRPYFPVGTWESCNLRVEANTRKLLDLFERHGIQSTFFVLGWIAERCPLLVKEIRKEGHEVASHGYGHKLAHQMSKAELRDDLHRSKVLLEDLTGEAVLGYRAPKFSVNNEVLKTLVELGYRYDSSLNTFNVASNRNGVRSKGLTIDHSQSSSLSACASHLTPCAPLSPFLSSRSSFSRRDPLPVMPHGVFELPISHLKFGRITVPVGGGGYFRLWPVSWTEKGIAHILHSEGRYVFYIHPWEVDPDQPRVKNVQGIRRFRHYCGLDKTLDRLDHLLTRFKDYPFFTCKQYIENIVS